MVLLHGEAGIGKTSLVSAIRSQLPAEMRMLVGSCDALSTPRTLGPFRDLAAAVGPRLGQALQAGERDVVMDALLDELQRPPPSTLVVEDVHWADEATLDTLRFLVRRIAQLPVVLLLTYRDDELSRTPADPAARRRFARRAGTPPEPAAPLGAGRARPGRRQPTRRRKGLRPH